MPVFVTPARRKITSPAKRMIIHTAEKKSAWWKVFFFYYWKWIVWSIIGATLIYFVFYYNRSPIQRVVFDQSTQETMAYQDAFEDIQAILINKSYYKEKNFHRTNLEETIRTKYPIIAHISHVSFNNGTLTLALEYHQPDFLMSTENNVEWLVYKNSIVPNTSWTILGSTGIHIHVVLPEDIFLTYSWGVFWASPSQHIAQTIKKIDFITWFSSITYYPGREKLSLEDGKNTFIIGLDPSKLETTFSQRKKIMPYLPTAIPAKVDLSNPSHIIIQH